MTDKRQILPYWVFFLFASILFILSIIIPIILPIWLALLIIFLSYNILKPYMQDPSFLDYTLGTLFAFLSVFLIIALSVNALYQIKWWQILILAFITAILTEIVSGFSYLPKIEFKKSINNRVYKKQIDFPSTIAGVIIILLSIWVSDSMISGSILGLILALFITFFPKFKRTPKTWKFVIIIKTVIIIILIMVIKFIGTYMGGYIVGLIGG